MAVKNMAAFLMFEYLAARLNLTWYDKIHRMSLRIFC